jgi:3-hydroxy-5-methyl-1-naphthoate 3-O-methyltransferase
MTRRSFVDRHSIELAFLLAGVIRSGLLEGMSGVAFRSAGEIARAAGTDARASRIVLDALASEGIAERSTAGYRLSPEGRAHLVDLGSELERNSILLQVNKMESWLALPESIRTGRPAPRDPVKADRRSYLSAMGERDPVVAAEIVERVLAYGGRMETMLDVGGAVGHMAKRFSDCGVRATLLDREETMPVARDFLGSAVENIALVAGDYTQGLPPGPFDLIYLGNVYHIYPPETNARVTKNAFASLNPGGTMAIQDLVAGRSPRAAMFGVNMLIATQDGGIWTEEQHRAWLSGAGFERIEVVDLSSGSQLVLGRRPTAPASSNKAVPYGGAPDNDTHEVSRGE